MSRGHNHSQSTNQSSNYLDKFLIAIFLLLVLFGVGFVVYVRFIKQDMPTTKQAKLTATEVSPASLSADEKLAYETSNKFLNNIQDGKYKDAFELMSKELKGQYKAGQDDFEKSVKQANVDKLRQWVLSDVSTNGSQNRITVKGAALFDTPNNTAKLEFGYYKNTEGKYQLYSWQIYPEI